MSEHAGVVGFLGPCPFLTCTETGPHEHVCCPDCGAVRHGNMFCNTCIKEMDLDESTKEMLLESNTARLAAEQEVSA